MLTVKEIIQTADNMAAAASEMGMMGYDNLIANRELLKDQLTEVFKVFDLNRDRD